MAHRRGLGVMALPLAYPECYECAYNSPHTHTDGEALPANTTPEQETQTMNIYDMLDAQAEARETAIQRFTKAAVEDPEEGDESITQGDSDDDTGENK